MTMLYRPQLPQIPKEVLRAWNLGDIAALEDRPSSANPYEGGSERAAWSLGWDGKPLPDSYVEQDAAAERAEDFSGLAPGTGDAA